MSTKDDKKTDAAESTEVAKTSPAGGVAGYDYGDHAGAGFEDTKGSDLSVPFLGILQSNSPQVEEKDPEGAESGHLFNTVTREVIDGNTGTPFLPVHKELAYVQWIPRNKGGGFVNLHDPNGEIVAKAIEENDGERIGKLKTPSEDRVGEDDELVETNYVYGLMLDDAGVETTGFGVISFTSTKIKPYRDWITAMYTLKGKPPMFANRARIRTVKQKNEHGTFYNFRIDPLMATWVKSLIDPVKEAALIKEAAEFREMVTSGMARAAFETEKSAEGAKGGGSGDGGGGDAPF